MREATVAASIVVDMLDYLRRLRVDTDRLCLAVDLDADGLLLPDRRVPGSIVERLWIEAELSAQDPYLGLHMGESHQPGALDILGYVVLSCGTAGEVLDRLSRYAPILNDGLRVQLTAKGTTTQCRFEAVEGLDNYLTRAPRHPIEALAAGVTVALRNLTGRAIPPREVTFTHDQPAATGDYEKLFGVTPRWGATEHRMVFLTTDLDAPVRSANPALLEVFERHAIAAADALDGHGPVSRRVVRLLSERVKGIAPALGEVAFELAMSARSLQRSLRDEGTSFQILLDDVRRELAVRHLAVRGTSAAEVAFLTGFSEPSAFSRAFRRWTGSTPGAYCVSAAGAGTL